MAFTQYRYWFFRVQDNALAASLSRSQPSSRHAPEEADLVAGHLINIAAERSTAAGQVL